MSERYNKAYYHSGCGPIPYEEPERWEMFFGEVADDIIEMFAPKTVLDAGCAMGYLVAALRDRGVEAYGIDISTYAIRCVREDIRPFCEVGSLTEPLPASLPARYDLVVTIEVLEHLYAEDGAKAIQHLCSLADTIVFSSTPDDFAEKTHVNVQQREYWARLFAQNGFYDDLGCRPTYITHYAACYQKTNDVLRQIEDYERYIRQSEQEHTCAVAQWSKAVEDKETHIQNQNAIIQQQNNQRDVMESEFAQERQRLLDELCKVQGQNEDLNRDMDRLQSNNLKLSLRLEEERLQFAEEQKDLVQAHRELEEKNQKCIKNKELLSQDLKQALVQQGKMEEELAHYKEHYFAAINQREEIKKQLADAQYAYQVISNAFFWKITWIFRVILDAIKRPFRQNRCVRLLGKGVRCLQENGVRYTWKKVQDWRQHRQSFAGVANQPLFTTEELEMQRKTKFSKEIRFSIVVPLYNTPATFLHEMIRSVLDQTYGNWELCMADGSDAEHGEVGQICKQYCRQDSRVKYQKLEKNLGISGNTNACLEMAVGDYIGLFDHDDLLHPAALFEVMRTICETGADFVYTDENTFHKKPEDAFCPHFKPDYAPDTLRGNNYICHFTVFKQSLLELTGTFHSDCDGSQDFDMILRLTEQAKKIVHIPKILYYWRAHPNSVADNVAAKPYVIEAAHRAVERHLSRIGLEGEVLDTTVPSIYRIKYKIQGEPLVSILIPNSDHRDDIEKCLESVYGKTTYQNFEVVIVENNSKSKEIFNFYSHLQKKWENIKVIHYPGHFNYSAINNFGAKHCNGKYFLLLNNDTEIISPDWIQEMLMFAQRKDVGAVGSKLYYPDDTIQHAGVGIGLLTLAGHLHRGFRRDHPGYMGRLIYAQNLSAVTAACVMIRKEVWEEVQGFDEEFEVAFNDIDLCMRIRQAGYLIVWTPYAELYHYESKSRGCEDTPEKQRRFEGEVRRFQERWAKELAAGDSYYNPNLTLDREDFSVR